MNLLVDIFLFLVSCIIFPSQKRNMQRNTQQDHRRGGEEMAHWIILDNIGCDPSGRHNDSDSQPINEEYNNGPEW